ncbi:MAG: hypothetical protein WCE62_01055 [Polyangiales bacterium]
MPISREPKTSAVQSGQERMRGTFPPPSTSAVSARALAIVSLSNPELDKPPETALSATLIREREAQSEPAPVLALHRTKAESTIQSSEVGKPADPQAVAPQVSVPDRDTSLPHVLVPPGPPILASDLLREQMRPSSPGERALRRTTVVLGVVGALGASITGGAHPLTVVSLALLITMATLALTPMSYGGRAIALFLIGSVATGVALWQQTLQGLAPDGMILGGATILLSGSLLFRAYYRGARIARTMVSCGVLALGTWFFVSGGHQMLVTLEGNWQSWGPAVTHMMFGLLALLSLMAFMDNSTRGGSHVWAVALLVVYAAHVTLVVASEIWPMHGSPTGIDGPTIAAILTGVVGTLVAAMALAQVLVVLYQAASSRIKERVSVVP